MAWARQRYLGSEDGMEKLLYRKMSQRIQRTKDFNTENKVKLVQTSNLGNHMLCFGATVENRKLDALKNCRWKILVTWVKVANVQEQSINWFMRINKSMILEGHQRETNDFLISFSHNQWERIHSEQHAYRKRYWKAKMWVRFEVCCVVVEHGTFMCECPVRCNII